MKALLKISCPLWVAIGTMLFFISCEKKEDLRQYDEAKIVGVKVNDELYLPVNTADVSTVTIPAGRDLSNIKLHVLVANGQILHFENEAVHDARQPLRLTIAGDDGTERIVNLKVVSPPAISSFIIDGLTITHEYIFFGANSLIVQVPPATDLTSLAVTMEFLNATLVDFVNGSPDDYTNPKRLSLLGVDGETRYEYDFIITTEEVGPAVIRGMVINGIETDSVVLTGPLTVVPYVKGLTNFSAAEVVLETGFGNRIDPAFTGQQVNLLTGDNKVKITGSDGIEKEFTIGRPQLSLTPLFTKEYDAFGFGANDLAGVAFSGNHIVVANYSAVAPVAVGPNYYDLAGNQVGVLNKTGVRISHSLRKVASDVNGKLLVAPLGIEHEEQTIYKWDHVSAVPVPYITYSRASMGLPANPRTAGINITGSLDGNAIITVGIAQRTEVFVWTVTGGVLNTTPTKYNFPYDRTAFYWGVEPLPTGTPGFIGAAVGNTFSGIISLNNTFTELHRQAGIIVSDCRAIAHQGRIYMAYTAFVAGRGALMRVFDITDGQLDSYRLPLMDVTMSSTAPNANNTMDTDLAVIDGKLHAVFACTNIGMKLFRLEN